MTSSLRVLVLVLLQFSAASASSDCKTGACSSQIDDVTAMLQSKAIVSLDGKINEDMMLLMSSGAGHLSQVSSSEKLAAAQRVERSMEFAAAKIINGSTNSVLPDVFYEAMLTGLEEMETQIVAEKEGFQTQLNDANGVVAQCNTNMNATLDGSVAAAKGNADNKQSTHQTCREAEVLDSTAKNASCGKLTSDTSSAALAVPKCNCQLSTSNSSAVLTCIAANKNWVDTHESDLQTQESDCNAKTATWSSKAEDCDLDQENYEVAYCTYAEQLEDMCSDLGTCYNDAIEARTTIVGVLVIDEEHIKAVLASAKKLVCYVRLIRRSATENVTMSDFEVCRNMDVSTDTTYLSTSVPDLDITYTPPVAMQTCPTLPNTPGDQDWADREYAAFRQDWLREMIVCPHKTTTTANPEGYEFAFDGCPRKDVSGYPYGAGMTNWNHKTYAECADFCTLNVTGCTGFEVNGCTADRQCTGGNCWTFTEDVTMLVNRHCVSDGRQKTYFKVTTSLTQLSLVDNKAIRSGRGDSRRINAESHALRSSSGSRGRHGNKHKSRSQRQSHHRMVKMADKVHSALKPKFHAPTRHSFKKHLLKKKIVASRLKPRILQKSLARKNVMKKRTKATSDR